ncbi:hypothetical protein PF002_g3545 [Phytophthora fragariae]|uniref:Uncharacterized protein n=1 Tax=Phytophthora fragariae TaxID=53985 RepID=A0A6A3FSG1_9STRA|nr:hypothetical protein PF009_g3387 [Phytophthora fragariae]KAE9253024.1 hypothetical protein PF002_g3545 [Phytophthora fragariae]
MFFVSGNPGCTGEAIIESGIARSPDTSNYDTPEEEEEESETDSVDSPKEARNKAKAKAKTNMQPKNRSSRPVDVDSASIRYGFDNMTKLLSSRKQAVQTNGDAGVVQSIEKLAASIELSNEMQQQTTASILQSIANFQQQNAETMKEMLHHLQQPRSG